MVRVFTTLATLALLLGFLSTPANASHLSIYIYSPYTNSNWYFSQGNHNGRMNNEARDVAWPSTPSNITFNATSGATGVVTAVANNCNSTQTWDKYVTLSLYYGGDFYGQVSYVHITSPTVSVNDTISAGTSLGSPQTQSSDCWTAVHSHMERSSNGTWVSDYICGQGCATENQFPYSSAVVRMLHSNIQRPVGR